jgi:hypothetical protein
MRRPITSQSGGKSKRRRWNTTLLAVSVMACMASSAHAAPAIDEYTLRLPDAAGEGDVGPNAPSRAQPSELPSKVRTELKKSSDAPSLASIATAEGFKAPPPVSGELDEEATDDRGFVSAAGSTLTDPIGIAMFLALAGIIATAAFLRSRASGPESG